MPVNTNVLGKDVRYFLVAYGIAIGAAFLPSEARLGALAGGGPADRHLRRLRAGALRGRPGRRRGRHHPPPRARSASTGSTAGRIATIRTSPRLRIVNLQVLAALGLIIGRCRRLRRRRRSTSRRPWACRPSSSSLVIAPIATELPEKFNSIIWVRQRRTPWRWATSPARWSSSRASRRSWRCSSPPKPGRSTSRRPSRSLTFASAGIAFVSTLAIFLPMVRRRHPARSAAPRGRGVLRRLPGAGGPLAHRRHLTAGYTPRAC